MLLSCLRDGTLLSSRECFFAASSLGFLVMLGLVAVYYDLRKGIVPNRLSLAMIVSGLLLNLLYKGSWDYLSAYLLGVLMVLALGVFLWRMTLIGAGDAKLLAGVTALVPLFVYKNPTPTAPLGFLANTALLAGLFVFVTTIARSKPREWLDVARDIANPRNLFNSLLYVFSFLWLIRLATSLVGVESMILELVVLFFLFEALDRFKKSLQASLVDPVWTIVIARILVEKSALLSIGPWKELVYYTLFIMLLRRILIGMSTRVNTRLVKIEDLREGMIPCDEIYYLEERGRFISEKRMYSSYFDMVRRAIKPGSSFFEDPLRGLTRNDIERLKTLKRKGLLEFPDLRVYETSPLALWALLGAVLTFIFGGSLV